MRRVGFTKHERRGFTLVLMTFMITVLIGAAALAVDAGQMYRYRAQIHAGADAAALAGVFQMTAIDSSHTVDTTVSYAGRHLVGTSAVSLASSDVIPGTWTPAGGFVADATNAFGNGDNAVKVTTRYTANYTFARIFGFNTKALTATSVAYQGFASGSTCTRPWAVPYQLLLNALYPNPPLKDATTYNLTTTDVANLSAMTTSNNVSLKIGDNTSGIVNGNFYGVELPPIVYADGTLGTPWSGGNNYRTAEGETCAALAAQMGSNPYVSVGDWLAPENGNMQGPTQQGFQDLCGLNGNNYVCANPVRVVVALWDTYGNAPGASSGCGGKCFHVKYLGVFYVTQYNTSTNAVVGYFQTMANSGSLSTTPSPIKMFALVQ